MNICIRISYCVSFILLGCSKDICTTQKITLHIINELQDCEENNLHYTVIKVKNHDCKSLEGQIVLPVLSESINNNENNELLFPAETIRRKLFVVEGFYSKKAHRNISDGCSGSHSFTITEILEEKELNGEYNYPIDYK